MSPEDLGDANSDEVRAAAIAAFGQDPDISLSPIEQLCAKVVALSKIRLSDAAHAADERSAHSAIFVLTSQLRKDRERLKAVRVPNVATGSQRLAGHVWVVPPNLATAGRLDVAATTMGEAFNEIEELGLGAYPTVVVEYSTATMGIYRNGVHDDEDRLFVRLTNADLETTPLSSLLDQFVTTCIVTPNCQSQIRTWIDGAEYIPVMAAEKNIQELLFMFLRARLIETHKIDAEVTLRSGRLDLMVRRKLDSAVWRMAAALELKVARSCSSTGKPKTHAFLQKHIARGYRQIREYTRELEADEGWLVTYDMRRLDARLADPFAAHHASAQVDGLRLLLQPLYGTADDYRDHQAA